MKADTYVSTISVRIDDDLDSTLFRASQSHVEVRFDLVPSRHPIAGKFTRPTSTTILASNTIGKRGGNDARNRNILVRELTK